ncbi:MAG: CBS domain-containing protein, partial [Deltaproteobacteria bacterium]
MNPNPVVVWPELTLEQFVDNFLIKYPYKMFPVVRANELLGTISMDELKTLSKVEWSRHTVQEYLKPVSPQNSVSPQSDAKAAFMLMSSGGESRLLV